MKSRSILLYFIIPLIIIILGLGISYMLVFQLLRKPKANSIIQNYENSSQKYKILLEEISEFSDNMDIIKKGSNFSVIIYQYNEIGLLNNIIEVKENDLKQYNKVFQLMMDLKLDAIYKKHNNLILLPKYSFNQYIVNLNDESKYKYEHAIVDMKNIEQNWYYIETK